MIYFFSYSKIKNHIKYSHKPSQTAFFFIHFILWPVQRTAAISVLMGANIVAILEYFFENKKTPERTEDDNKELMTEKNFNDNSLKYNNIFLQIYV